MAKGSGSGGRSGRGGGGAASVTTIEGNRGDFKVGDDIYIPPTKQEGRMFGEIESIGRVNLKVKTEVQFAPNGPIYTQFHNVRISNLPPGTRLHRTGQIFEVRR